MGLSVEHWKDPKAHPAKLHHPAAFPHLPRAHLILGNDENPRPCFICTASAEEAQRFCIGESATLAIEARCNADIGETERKDR